MRGPEIAPETGAMAEPAHWRRYLPRPSDPGHAPPNPQSGPFVAISGISPQFMQIPAYVMQFTYIVPALLKT